MLITSRYVVIGSTPPTYSRLGVVTTASDPYFQIPTSVRLIPFIVKNRKEFRRKSGVIVVASPSHIFAIPLRLLTSRKIILDAGWPLSDSVDEISSLKTKIKFFKNFIIDFLSFHLSHKLVLETPEQKIRVSKRFALKSEKIEIRYTGFAYPDTIGVPEVCSNSFQEILRRIEGKRVVLFRGKDNREAGIDKILEISKFINSKTIIVIASSNISREFEVEKNVIIIPERLTRNELACLYACTSLSIGQLGESSRILWTLPHKFFESAALGIPYLTKPVGPILRICQHREVSFFKSSDSLEMATQIESLLSNNVELNNQSLSMKKLSGSMFSKELLREQFEASIRQFFW